MFRVLRRFAMTFLCAAATLGFSQDAEGCKDHPLLTRMPGFILQRCRTETFGTHEFLTGKGRKTAVEGRFTELLYTKEEGAAEPSRLQLQRNFENAVTKIGGTVTGKDDDGQVCLKVTKDGREVWAHLDAYVTFQYRLVIIEKEAMKQDIVASAATLGAGIKSEGKIAVYGITFDTGKADLKPESEPTLAEIAKLLKSQPALKLHVVGHTDNVAGIDLNLKLSQARAEAVVQALVAKHAIAANRLRPQGVGPVCPVAANDTEEGRAKNRRVELVKQ